MEKNPLMILLMLAASGYIFWLWAKDWQATSAGHAVPGALPGTTSARPLILVYAAVGAGLLLTVETWGEYRLGISEEQSRITLLFGIYTLFAAVVEEIIFRGYIVIENHGNPAKWAGVIAASLVFALIHPFLWEWKGWHDGGLLFVPTRKAWFSTSMTFAGSLWFYTVRFWPLNPSRSLWPCFAAHMAKNLGVLLIKYAQGFGNGLW